MLDTVHFGLLLFHMYLVVLVRDAASLVCVCVRYHRWRLAVMIVVNDCSSPLRETLGSIVFYMLMVLAAGRGFAGATATIIADKRFCSKPAVLLGADINVVGSAAENRAANA